MPCCGVGAGAGAGDGIFGNGGVGLGLGIMDGIGDTNGEGVVGSGMGCPILNRLGCPPKIVGAAFVVGGVTPVGLEGEPQELGAAVLGVNAGKLVGSVNKPEEPGVVVVLVTLSAQPSDGAGAGVVVDVEIAGAGFSPEMGANDGNGDVFGRTGSASAGCRGGGGLHWPKGTLGAVGCRPIVGGADLETGGGFSTSPSRTRGVLASGELRKGRLIERGARPKGEVGGGEALSGGT